MNFSVSDSIGFLGGWIMFGGLMLIFTVVVTLIIRAVRGRDNTPTAPDERAPEDDYIL